MGEKQRMDPRKQFSKWLARWTAIYWFMHMTGMAVLCMIQPNVADAAVYMAIISSVVMLVNVWAYTRNSVYEKAILAGMDIKGFRFSWKNSRDKQYETEQDDTEEEEGEADG